jgi:hypothetical protein
MAGKILALGLALLLTLTAQGCGGGDKAAEPTGRPDATERSGDNDRNPTSTPTRDEDEGENVSLFDLDVGDCLGERVEEGEFEEVLVVDCGASNAVGEVVNLVEVDDTAGGDFPGEAFLDNAAAQECNVPGGVFTYYIPTEGSWDEGDRTITCIADLGAEFEVGACVDDDAIVVDCNDPSATTEITALIDLSDNYPGEEFPGEDEMQSASEALCAADETFLYPSEFTWTAGDREVVCLAILE